MAEISNSVSSAAQLALERLGASTIGTSEANVATIMNGLQSNANIDIEEVTFHEGDVLIIPANEADRNNVLFMRPLTLNGRESKAFGIVLDCTDGPSKGLAKTLYFSSLKKTAVPYYDGAYHRDEIVRPDKNITDQNGNPAKADVYADVMRTSNMKDFYNGYFCKHKGIKCTGVSKSVSVARMEYDAVTKRSVITGTRNTTVYSFAWVD